MTNILIKQIYGSVYRKNKFFKVRSDVNVFYGFRQKLAKLGVYVNTLDVGSLKEADVIVFFDIPFFWEVKAVLILLMSKKKKVLFCFEPPIINPFDHRKFFYRFFDLVYTWNDRLVDNKKVKKFYLPVLDPSETRELPFGKKRFICMINGNKSVPRLLLALSPFRRVLYEERLRAINFFETNAADRFDLYGRGWNQPKRFSLKENFFGFVFHRSYRGSVSGVPGAKLTIMSKYKFNICFENCVVDGYISEKIIDCFKAHTVPVYLGAPNIEKYIPKSCFIDFREFGNYPTLLKFLAGMEEETYNSYIRNAKKLLDTRKFKDVWFEGGFLKVFLGSISFFEK